MSEKVARFGGSWSFIITFAVLLAAWILFNTAVATKYRFDAYPFILMNLVLSTVSS